MDEPTAQPPQIPADIAYKSKLVDVLYEDPKMRPKLLALVKEYAPGVRIPELDTRNEVVAALEPHLKEMAAGRDEMRKFMADTAVEREWKAAEDAGYITPEERPEVEKVMKERGITSRQTAAEFHAQTKRAAAPRSVMPSPFTIGAAPDMKELMANPTQWARKQAFATLNELGGRNR